MAQQWSFGRKLAAGFGIAVAFTALNGFISVQAMHEVVSAKDAVIDRDARVLIDAAELNAAVEAHVAAFRGFLLTRESRYVDMSGTYQAQVTELFRKLRAHMLEARDDIPALETEY